MFHKTAPLKLCDTDLQPPELIQQERNHAHPCNFRLSRVLDRGWGEMAFEYHWDSDSGCKGEDGTSNPDLSACSLYEYTTYADNAGEYADGYYYPPCPPFVDWKFRHPTDGRTAPIALGCFGAAQGWAWDRHKLGGRLEIPADANSGDYTIVAVQQYRFHCAICGLDGPVPGAHAGLHPIIRRFALSAKFFRDDTSDPPACNNIQAATTIWRYVLRKHDAQATMDIDANGYVDDSAHIGFGPV